MGIRKFFSRGLTRLNKIIESDYPKHYKPTENDVHLVSFPRSGNTWMRVILAEILYGKSGDGLDDLQYFIPDNQVRFNLNRLVDSEFHVVKSHYPLNYSDSKTKKYNRVIYLIRDPRDVVVSHYRYMSARGYTTDFDNFLIDWVTGRIWPTSWREHVNSWIGIDSKTNDFNICIIRYEDLLSEPIAQVQKAVDIIGIEANLNTVQRALDLASAENMRNKEKLGLRKGEDVVGMKYIGEAVDGQWKAKLNSNQVKLIEEHANVEMRKYGYL